MTNEVDTRSTQERELSWLRFDERVLAEARDETVPLFERLKFAAIFTSNLDEFFMIRVGSLDDMTLVKEEHIDSRTGQTPEQQLQAIFKAVTPLYKQRDKIVSQLEKRLRSCNICVNIENLAFITTRHRRYNGNIAFFYCIFNHRGVDLCDFPHKSKVLRACKLLRHKHAGIQPAKA